MTGQPAKLHSARATLGNLATKAATYPLSFVAAVLVARALGPADRGVYAFLATLGALIIPLVALGFPAGLSYFVGSGRYKPADAVLTCILVGALQGGVVASALGLLWRFDALGQSARSAPAGLMIPILAIMPIQGVHLTVHRLLAAASDFGAANLFTLAIGFLSPCLMLGLVIGAGLGLAGAVYAFVATQTLVTGFLVVHAVRRYRAALRVDVPLVREAFGYGVRAWPGEAALRANVRLDQVVLGWAAPPATLGHYAVAVTLSELLWYGPDALGPVLFNRLAGMRDDRSRAELVERVHRVVLLLLVPAALGLALFGPVFIPLLYGQAYAEGALLLVLLLPGTVSAVTMKVLTKYFAGSGMAGRSSTSALFGSVAGIVLYLVLIPAFGAAGASLASSVGYTIMGITAWWLYRDLVRSPEPRLFVATRDDLTWATAGLRGALGAWGRRAP